MIGDITSAFKNASTASKTVTDILKSASTMEDAASALSKVNLPIDKFQLLKSAFGDASDEAIKAALGITDVGAASEVATTGITGIGAALKGLAVAHPFLTIATGVAVAVAAIVTYKKHLEEVEAKQIAAAKEAGDAWAKSSADFEEQIDKVRSLRESLESGDLTDQEIYDTKLQILDIQQQIVEQYGAQAEGIDLVNGKLDDQLEKLSGISRSEAQSIYNSNRTGFINAQKKMSMSLNKANGAWVGNDYYIGDVGREIGAGQTEFGKAVQDVISKYTGMKQGAVTDRAEVPIYFTGNTEEAVDTFSGMMSEIEKLQTQYGETENEAANNLLSNLESALNVAQKIYDDNYETAKYGHELQLRADDTKYSAVMNSYKQGDTTIFPTKSQTVSEWLDDYTEAINNYNKALASGDTEKIDEAKTSFNEVHAAVNQLLKDENFAENWAQDFGEAWKTLNTTAINANNFKKQLTSDAEDGIGSIASMLKDLELSDVNLKDMLITDGLQDGEEQLNALIEAAMNLGIITGDSAEEVQPLIDILVELGIVSSETAETVVDTGADIASAFEGALESSKNMLSHLDSVASMLNSMSTGKSISAILFDDAEMLGYASALEYVNGTIQINSDKVRELAQAKAEEQIATNDATKAMQQSQYLKNAREIEKLRDALKEMNEEDAEYTTTLDQIAALQNSNDLIASQCTQLDLYSQSLREATGAYQAWLDAQSAGSYGDMAKDVRSAMGNITDVWDSESDQYQRFGDTKYTAAVEFLVPDEVSAQGKEAVKSYIDDLGTYFTGGIDGAQKFVQESIDKGLMEYTPDGESIVIAANKTMGDFAEAFNWTDEAVQAIFGDLQTYDFHFDWSDEAVKTLGDLAVAATQASDHLRTLEGNEDLSIKIDVSDIEDADEKVATLDQTVKEMQSYRSTLEVDSTEYQEANDIIAYCLAMKQQIEAPAIMYLSVGNSGVDAELQNALSLLQQFQAARDTVEMQATVGADTSAAEEQVQSLQTEIDGLSPEIKVQLGLSDTSNAESISESINALEPEVLVSLGVNEEAFTNYEPEDKDSTVVFGINTDAPDGYDPEDKSAQVVYTVNDNAVSVWTAPVKYMDVITRVSGTGSVDGTAHVSGTAMASGDWGNKEPGNTLVGELGREIVVDPKTGRWYTVGDNGAEFRNIPKNAIVFNHEQTEALLERGHVNGRGSAKVSGTAFVGGAGGSANFLNVNSSSSSSTNSEKNNTAAVNANTKATKDNTKSKTKEKSTAEKLADLYDWVAVRLKYFANKTKAIADQINDYISKSLKTTLLSREMKAVQKELNANATGANLYKEQANTVARQTGMSKSLIKKAQTGAWQFENLSDANKEKVEAYLKYYDKYTSAKQKVQELRNEQLKLFEDWANMPIEKAEEKIKKLQSAIDGLKSAYSTVSSGGSAVAAYTNVVTSYGAANVSNAEANVDSAQSKADTAKSNLDSAKSTLSSKSKATDKIEKALKKAVKNNKSKVSSSVQTKINNALKKGTKISLTSAELKHLPSSVKKQITSYNKAVDAETKASKAVTTAKSTYSKAQTNLSNAQNTLSNLQASQTEAQRIASQYGNDVSFRGQNAMLDAQLSNQKGIVDAYNTALTQSTSNINTASNQKAAADAAAASASAAVTKKADSILGNKKYTKNLTSAQKKALKAGKTVSTSGIKDKKTLTAIKAYNKLVTDAQTKTGNAETAALNYNTAIEAQATTLDNLAEAQSEYASMLVDNERQKFENIQNYYNAQKSYQQALTDSYSKARELKEKYGQDTTEQDYQKEIDSIVKQKALLENERVDLQNQLNSAVSNGIIKQGSEEWYSMQTQIQSLSSEIDGMTISVLDLQDSMRNEVFYRALDKALKKAEQLSSALSTIGGLISDEMLFDDSGQMTDFGVTALAMDIKEYESNLNELQTLLQKRERIMQAYNNGNNATNYSRSEFEEDLSNITTEIQNALKDTNSLRTAVVDMIAKTSKAELDATLKVIDARVTLLQKQKDYYDYDKTLKTKTKDLQLLDQQIAALDGVRRLPILY